MNHTIVEKEMLTADRRLGTVKTMVKNFSILAASLILCVSCTTVENAVWPEITSAVKADASVEVRVEKILSQMSLAEKVGQITQAEIGHSTPADVKKYHLGSVLNGGGSFPAKKKSSSIQDWVDLADAYYDASMDASDGHIAIPVIWGTDAVHGHNNVIGATLYPHNIGLGAANNPQLLEQIGAATAREVAVTGIDWIFAPTLAVVQDDRWGRTYESFSEDPSIVRAYAGKIVEGLQGRAGSDELFDAEHVVATAKHFLGDGGTVNGVDQGDNITDEQVLFDVHGQGYVTALAAGAQTVMATFNSWHGDKIHGSKYLLTDVLRGKMGFDGFVIGDWNGHGQVAGCTNESCAAAVNAGVDMIMVPEDWKAFIANTTKQVQSGEISHERLDEAVRRILRVKIRAGMFEQAKPSKRPLAGDVSIIGNTDHRELARRAVRESLVLLKNNNQILPLARDAKVMVSGSVADNIGQQSGGWTITWQGTDNLNSDFPGATSIFGGIQKAIGGNATLSVDGSFNEKPDVAIVVFGETPYAEGQGDRANIHYNSTYPNDLALLKKLKSQGIPVVSVFITGRPLWVNPEINQSDAFVVAWLPGTEGAGVSDVLFKSNSGAVVHDFTGRLPFSWPAKANQYVLNKRDPNYQPLFAFGAGLSYGQQSDLSNNLSEDVGAAASKASEATAATSNAMIFNQRSIEPFQMYIGDAASWQIPVKGAFTNSNGGALSVKTADFSIQEDARQITWSGTAGYGQVYWQTQQKEDFSGYSNHDSALQMNIRVDQKPSGNVTMRMDCGYPCGGSVDLTEALNARPLNEWGMLTVDLQCFENDGAKMDRINTPVLLTTAGKFQMTIADVQVALGAAKEATVSCQN